MSGERQRAQVLLSRTIPQEDFLPGCRVSHSPCKSCRCTFLSTPEEHTAGEKGLAQQAAERERQTERVRERACASQPEPTFPLLPPISRTNSQLNSLQVPLAPSLALASSRLTAWLCPCAVCLCLCVCVCVLFSACSTSNHHHLHTLLPGGSITNSTPRYPRHYSPSTPSSTAPLSRRSLACAP